MHSSELEGMDVSSLTLEDERGRMVPLSEFRGKPVILNFWASWCLPCRVELPQLAGVYPELKSQEKVLIGANLQESWTTIDNFRNEVDIPFPVLRDDGTLASKLGIQIIPALVIIDAEGRLDSIVFGYRPWVSWYLRWWI